MEAIRVLEYTLVNNRELLGSIRRPIIPVNIHIQPSGTR
jgi:hypothetical protein